LKCPKCDFENPENTHFCGNCAAPLTPADEISETREETILAPKIDLTTGSTFADRYQIIEQIGKGGMGKVYKVLDKEVNAKVALKLINPDVAADEKTIERFRNELKTARDITHNNVCRMYDLNKHQGSYYITMEFVPGEDLKSSINRMGPLSTGKAISIAKQVCQGLAEAHKLGVVHRDLKPQNIMIDKGGNAKIMDFGIARSLKAKGITDKGLIIGTPEYMSPEQVEGKGIDQRSDIYSLGIILYEMLTGRVPFEGETPLSIALKHKSEMPKDPRELNAQIPEDLSQVILKCLEKERSKRFQKAEELLLDLKKIEEGIPTTEKVLPRRPKTTKDITVTFRRSWVAIAALFVAVIAIGIGVIYIVNKRPAPIGELEKEKKMLVVLPFENLGPPEDEYFADGITEEISARLGSIAGLGVIARTSANKYKDTNKSIQEISEELGVNYILEGSVRWQKAAEDQGKVRVTPQLIRVSDGTHIWADVYDETIADVFQVQSDIAKQVVHAMDIALLEPELRALESRPTDDSEAYNYYLRGRDYFKRFKGEKDYLIAIQMFEEAINLDSDFALAYAELSKAHTDLYYMYYDRSQERLRKAKKAVDKALQIDPDLPEVNLALGYYYYHGEFDLDRALELFEVAQKDLPNDSELMSMIGFVQRRQAKWEKALANIKKASELNPHDPNVKRELASTFYFLREYKQAERYYDEAIALAPDNPFSYQFKAWLYLQWKGDTKRAREVLEEAGKNLNLSSYPGLINLSAHIEIIDRDYRKALELVSLLPDDLIAVTFSISKDQLYAWIYTLMGEKKLARSHYEAARESLEKKIKDDPENSQLHGRLGIVYASLGFKEEAIRECKLLVELYPPSKDAVFGPYQMAVLAAIYAIVGEHDEAIDMLEDLLSGPSPISIPLLRIDPTYDPLRDHPRFQKLVSQEE
jgi:TolB-like protein/Flp pilus assembly protein TadD